MGYVDFIVCHELFIPQSHGSLFSLHTWTSVVPCCSQFLQATHFRAGICDKPSFLTSLLKLQITELLWIINAGRSELMLLNKSMIDCFVRKNFPHSPSHDCPKFGFRSPPLFSSLFRYQNVGNIVQIPFLLVSGVANALKHVLFWFK